MSSTRASTPEIDTPQPDTPAKRDRPLYIAMAVGGALTLAWCALLITAVVVFVGKLA